MKKIDYIAELDRWIKTWGTPRVKSPGGFNIHAKNAGWKHYGVLSEFARHLSSLNEEPKECGVCGSNKHSGSAVCDRSFPPKPPTPKCEHKHPKGTGAWEGPAWHPEAQKCSLCGISWYDAHSTPPPAVKREKIVWSEIGGHPSEIQAVNKNLIKIGKLLESFANSHLDDK